MHHRGGVKTAPKSVWSYEVLSYVTDGKGMALQHLAVDYSWKASKVNLQ